MPRVNLLAVCRGLFALQVEDPLPQEQTQPNISVGRQVLRVVPIDKHLCTKSPIICVINETLNGRHGAKGDWRIGSGGGAGRIMVMSFLSAPRQLGP